MKTFQILFTLAFVALTSVTALAGIPLNNFNGTFFNENGATKGISKIKFNVSGNSVKVQAFGSCTPTDCDWGKVQGTAFSQNISTPASSNTEAIQAVYNFSHANTYVVITPISKNRIAVRTMTIFKTGNRKPYTKLEYLRKRAIVAVKLPAPRLISPRNGSVFNHFPRKTTLRWGKVQGAVKYIVEVDCYHCCQSGKWCTQVGKTWKEETVAGTSYTFNFVGAQPGRWRVTAVAANGKKGKTSGWYNFKYTK